jgi:hypothetical protein
MCLNKIEGLNALAGASLAQITGGQVVKQASIHAATNRAALNRHARQASEQAVR